mgnify:CR=1 FL=1
MARRLPPVHLRYKMCLLLTDERAEAADKSGNSSIAIDCDRYQDAIDFCNRFSEGGWWQIYDRHVDKVIATDKSHGKKDY